MTEDFTLLCGLHRLEACKLLGWREIPAQVLAVDTIEAELAELDENLVRSDLTVLQQAEHLQRRVELLSALGLRAPSHRPPKDGPVTPLRTSTDIATEAGLSKNSLQKRLQIANDIAPEAQAIIATMNPKDSDLPNSTRQLLHLARLRNPLTQVAVVQMLADNKAHTVHHALRQLAADSRQPQPLPSGVYDVVLADPPWAFEVRRSDRFAVENGYPVMATAEICALPIEALSADDAVLFLWTTNAHLQEALEVMQSWGYHYVSNLAWVKPSVGPGHWLSMQHELLLVGKRGAMYPPPPELRPSSVLQAPRRGHSHKPEELYGLIEKMYPSGRYLELFAREVRLGWTAWGNEA